MESFQITKAQILALVRKAIADGTISKPELAEVLSMTPAPAMSPTGQAIPDLVIEREPVAAPVAAPKPATGLEISTTQLLQYIGGFIVLLGLGAFVATFWNDLVPVQRVLIALGGTLTAYVLGTALFFADTRSQSGVAFHLIAGCMAPFAAFVTLEEMFTISMEPMTVALVSLTLLLIYAVTYLFLRHLLFTFFMLCASISFLYSTIQVILPDAPIELWAHLTLLIGAAGIGVGRSFRGTHNEPLAEMMYFLGGAAMLIAPATVFGSIPAWELIYPFLLAFTFYLAISLHSKRLLTVSVLALMAYVVYMTGKHFADVVGWPIALIVLGILLIVIGYVALRFRDKV